MTGNVSDITLEFIKQILYWVKYKSMANRDGKGSRETSSVNCLLYFIKWNWIISSFFKLVCLIHAEKRFMCDGEIIHLNDLGGLIKWIVGEKKC